MSLQQKDPIFNQLHNIIKLINIARLKKISFYFVDAMPLESWISEGCRPAVTNSIVLPKIPNRHHLINLPHSWCGPYYHPYPLDDDITPSKSYNCFMNRMDPIRQSWLYQLVRMKIFEEGYVSFNMVVRDNPRDRNPHDLFQHQFETQCSIFHTEHEFIRSRLPYRNFTDNGDLTPICYDSKINLVLETYFDQNDIITYTEKTFRALQIPRPWLLFSHKHAVKYLQEMGFDTLDDIIDHTQYDNIDFCIERQVKLLDILVDLIGRDFDKDRLNQAAKHNQELLRKFSGTWMDDCLEAINKASEIAQ